MIDSHSDSASVRAYAAIREGILDGTHQVGDMLSEAALGAAIGLSRTPVRAALARLADEGWVTTYPKRGVLVRGMDQRAIDDLAQARLMLETSGVGQADAAQRLALAQRLRPELARQADALEAGDMSAFIELTVEFHRAFVLVGGNAVLAELDARLADRQRFLLWQHREALIARRVDLVAEHALLLDSLADDDPEAFASTSRAHAHNLHGTGA